jgi:hypothetical protein
MAVRMKTRTLRFVFTKYFSLFLFSLKKNDDVNIIKYMNSYNKWMCRKHVGVSLYTVSRESHDYNDTMKHFQISYTCEIRYNVDLLFWLEVKEYKNWISQVCVGTYSVMSSYFKVFLSLIKTTDGYTTKYLFEESTRTDRRFFWSVKSEKFGDPSAAPGHHHWHFSPDRALAYPYEFSWWLGMYDVGVISPTINLILVILIRPPETTVSKSSRYVVAKLMKHWWEMGPLNFADKHLSYP